jgi:hypothetical protein
VSDPKLTWARLEATEHADPPELPPGTRLSWKGCLQAPKCEYKLDDLYNL